MGYYKEFIIRYHGNLRQALGAVDARYDLIDEKYAIIKVQNKVLSYLKDLAQIEVIEESRPLYRINYERGQEQMIPIEKHGFTGKGLTVGWVDYKRHINDKNYKMPDGRSRLIGIHNGTKEYSENQIRQMKSKGYSREIMDICVGKEGIAPHSQVILVNWEKDEFYTADLIRSVRFIIKKSKGTQNPLLICLPFDIGSGSDGKNNLIREIINHISFWGKIMTASNLEVSHKCLDKNAGFRTLDIAYALAPENAEIDAFIIYNSVEDNLTIKRPDNADLYPLVFPYIGIRGSVAVIKETLKDYPAALITGTLAYILGNEPLEIKPTDFKSVKILKTPTDLKGTDTLIGIIDTGIDYTHPVFRDAQGKTRIVSIWDQTIGNESPYGYGTIYDQALINEALESPDPFAVVPHEDEWGNGTMLAGIAAGYSSDSKRVYKGVAPGASLAVVKLQPATPDMQEIYHGRFNPLGFSALDVARAFEYLSTLANKYQKPISICLPMGTNSGSHDGTSILDTIIMSYAEKPGVAVVFPAGEEANKAHHASGSLKEDNEQEIKLTIAQGQKGFMSEIWMDFGDRVEVSLKSPNFGVLGSTVMVLNKAQTYNVGNTSFVWSQGSKIDSDTGSQVIRFRLENPIPGDWLITIKGLVIFEGGYNMWIPKTGMILANTVLSPADPFTTIYNASASRGGITVTCYDKRSLSPTASSGRGFTRNNEVKPDFMVPGVEIPGPLPGNKWASATGTSVASAITVGITSLIYEDQYRQGAELANTITMKALLIEQVKRELTIDYPNPSRGYGLLDISTLIDSRK